MLLANGNQRKVVAAARVSFMIRCASLALFFGVTALGYVWQKNKIYQIGDKIRQQEQDLDALRKKQAQLQVQLAQLKSPRALEERCQAWRLGLVTTKPSQIVSLTEPSRNFLPPASVMVENSPPLPAAGRELAHTAPAPRNRGG